MTLLYILLALLGLGFLVFVHELGHYFVAKWAKMEVEIFSIGFGKALVKWKRGNVTWQVGWLPFGGYVKIKGMEVTKKSQGEYIDPYTIEGGFFSKTPVKRIAVAIAGPMANFLLAFIVLTGMWLAGGREKSFAEFTQIIGWVDPKSELYAAGVRPGDKLYSYEGKPYQSSKDLLYAALLSGKKVELKGAHVDWQTGQQQDFTYTISPYPAAKGMEGMMTTGIGDNARYLIYDAVGSSGKNELIEGSPMKESGIQLRDRLVWADGELLFSLEQLSDLMNRDYALLTVNRRGKSFLSRQPRVPTAYLLLSPQEKGEMVDWQYEAKIKTPLMQMKVLPYLIRENGQVEKSLNFVDEECRQIAFSGDGALEKPLQSGDRIVAIDGIPFTTMSEMLPLLQHHQVQIIVQGDTPLSTGESWKEEDARFAQDLPLKEIETVASAIGKEGGVTEVGKVRLLKPVTPLSFLQFPASAQAKELLHQQIAAKREEIQGVKDASKREALTRLLEQEQRRRVLGVHLQDRQVVYNPGPFALFGTIYVETWHTLRALLAGNLNPRWLSGPVGIVQVMHHGWELGVQEALFWIAAISINLGFLNLLPIPVLDGGYICLSLWEMVTRRRLHPRTMERLIFPFVLLLVGLLLFLTFQDVIRLF